MSMPLPALGRATPTTWTAARAGPQLFPVTFDAALHIGIGFGDVVVVDALGELGCHAKTAVALVQIAAQAAVVDPVLHKNALGQAVDLAFAAGVAGLENRARVAVVLGSLCAFRRSWADVWAQQLDDAGLGQRVGCSPRGLKRKDGGG